MKIALCLYGQPRFFSVNNTIIEHIINPYQPDIYMHTWWSKDDVGSTYSSAPWATIDPRSDICVYEDTPTRLIKKYNPKKIHYDKLNLLQNISKDKFDFDMKCMFYSIQQVVNYTLDSDIIYDAIVLTRYDARIKLFDMNVLIGRSEQLVVPENTNKKYPPGIFNHNLIVSTPESMKIYSGIYNFIDEYLPKCDSKIHEELIKYYLEQVGLTAYKDTRLCQTFFRSHLEDFDWEL
jgi:hypothetical protein